MKIAGALTLIVAIALGIGHKKSRVPVKDTPASFVVALCNEPV
jgi:hypothetical protein